MNFEWTEVQRAWREKGKPLADGFRYASDTNDRWLTVDELKRMATATAES